MRSRQHVTPYSVEFVARIVTGRVFRACCWQSGLLLNQNMAQRQLCSLYDSLTVPLVNLECPLLKLKTGID